MVLASVLICKQRTEGTECLKLEALGAFRKTKKTDAIACLFFVQY